MRWYRLAYNAFAVISAIPIVILYKLLPDQPLYVIPAPFAFAMLFIQGLAFVLLVIGVLQTGAFDFAGLYALIDRNPKTDVLVTDGLYRYMRHPLYTAGLLFIWFSPVMTLNQLTLYATFTLYILIGAYFEERKLLKDFGEAYADYRSRTAMLIPKIF